MGARVCVWGVGLMGWGWKGGDAAQGPLRGHLSPAQPSPAPPPIYTCREVAQGEQPAALRAGQGSRRRRLEAAAMRHCSVRWIGCGVGDQVDVRRVANRQLRCVLARAAAAAALLQAAPCIRGPRLGGDLVSGCCQNTSPLVTRTG